MSKVLARGIAALALLAALTAAHPALAGNPVATPFAASFKLGGTISFDLLEEGGRHWVADIEILKIRANCEGRAAELRFSIYGETKVLDDRTFAVRSEDRSGRGKAVVRGRFSRGFERAKGTARLFGRFRLENGEGRLRCETNKQEFLALPSG